MTPSVRPRPLLPHLLLLAATACGSSDSPGRAELPPLDGSAAAASPAGSAAEATAWSTPEGFPLPFSTVLPTGIGAILADAGRGAGITFRQAAGPAAESAELYLFVHPAVTTEAQAREVVRSIAETHGRLGARAEVDTAQVVPWALAQFRFSATGAPPLAREGWAALGRHAGRFFHIVVQHSPEQAAPFQLRVQQILNAWRWADTGGALAAG